ncbi:hypothetical protein [Staphylococcus carnosus]|uniref:hypothetical protein n=1 Tax=Staphylococcus carnosus TaxID=1281 RepID=UPI0020A2750B|nr:hypothetical protein [Staphylococcus carnosus]UTB81009.1 hypothetical protein A2I65_08955 [Staphylococcus carnosus]
MSYERTTKDSVEYIANKFAENPGHFAATILRMYWDMEKQCDQYKAERDTLIDDIAVLKANISMLEREKKEREKRAEEAMTLAEEANCQVVSLQELLEINESSTKDLILKLQNSDTQKIEDENNELKRLAESRKGTIKGLKRHVKDLRLQSNTYFDEWQNEQTTSRGLREQCKEYAKYASKYLYLTGHIRLKAEVNPSVSRYINLVNYIDKLEGGENEV